MAQALERQWNKRTSGWHSHVTSAPAFAKVLASLLDAAQPRPSDVCVDLGAGTGFVALALAPRVASVLAVDIAPAMAEDLSQRAREAGLRNVSTVVCDLSDLRLPEASADLIVSSYALHHLLTPDKRALVTQAARWLRPGGRLVIADMMFGHGGSDRDRAILRQKVVALAAKGPGGWWRIAKNLGRYGLGVGQEHPVPPEWWARALREAGFTGVEFAPIVAEAGLISGICPGTAARERPGHTA